VFYYITLTKFASIWNISYGTKYDRTLIGTNAPHTSEVRTAAMLVVSW